MSVVQFHGIHECTKLTYVTAQIKIRKSQEISSRSSVTILEADKDGYSALIDNKLCVRLGSTGWTPPLDGPWDLALSGRGFSIWTKPKPLLSAQ
jgi:hypothetical protein